MHLIGFTNSNDSQTEAFIDMILYNIDEQIIRENSFLYEGEIPPCPDGMQGNLYCNPVEKTLYYKELTPLEPFNDGMHPIEYRFSKELEQLKTQNKALQDVVDQLIMDSLTV